MKPDLVIAGDPGKKGALVFWSERSLISVLKMPETRGDLIALFRERLLAASRPVAYIEKISGFIPDGGASQMFEFGRNVERVGCILETLMCPVIEIQPKVWQKSLGLGSSERVQVPRMPRGMNKTEANIWKQANADEIKQAKAFNAKAKRDWKNKLKAEAQRRFPAIKVTLDNCDALLIHSVAMEIERNK